METTKETCQVPPAGWCCTRAAGHEGPCATHPTTPPAPAAAMGAGELLSDVRLSKIRTQRYAFGNGKGSHITWWEQERLDLLSHIDALTARLHTAEAVAESAFQDAVAARDAHAAEVAGLRAGYAELLASEFVPSGKAVKPEFTKGVNLAISMRNTAVRAVGRQLGIDLPPAP